MRPTLMMSMGLAVAFTSASIAQSQQDYSNQNDSQYRQSQQQRQQQQQSPRMQADWQETTVIGYDLDADGQTDVFYTVSRNELDEIRRRAQSRGVQMNQNRSFNDQRSAQSQWDQSDRYRQQSSQQRYGDQWSQQDRYRQHAQQPQRFGSQRGEPMWDGQPQPRSRSMQPMSVADIPPRTVNGTIRQIREFDLAGVEQKQTFARLETDDGNRLVVHLGPSDRLDSFDLRDNDEVSILAKPGRVNNRMVLTAEKIRFEGRTIDVQPQMTENLKVIKGSVIDKRTERFPGANDEALLVRVRDGVGQTHVVCIGSTNRIDEDDIERGEKIHILAQPTMLDNRPILMAKTVKVDGETIELQPLSASHSNVRPHLRRTGQEP